MLVKITASSILILTVLMIRAVFQKKVNPLFLYPVWLVVALRLLLPGMLFFSPVSIMNTRLWDAGSRMIAEENSRQDTLYKAQMFQEYYEKKEAQQAVYLDPEQEVNLRACLKIHARHLHAPLCGIFGSNSGYIARYAPFILPKAPTNCDIHLAESNFQTRSRGSVKTETEAAGKKTEQNTGYEKNVESFELEWRPAGTLFGRIRQAARLVWAMGMVFFTMVFGWQNLRFYRYLRRTRKKWMDYSAGGRKITVYTAGDKLASPCLFGLVPAVYVPASGNKESLSMALEHEAVHYRHGDHIWAFVRVICLITNWYNPLVWICARLSVWDGELACDAGCIRRLGEEKRSAYGEALLAAIKQTKEKENFFQYGAMMTSGKKFMAKRIACIARNRKGSRISLALMVMMLVFCAGCTFTGAGQPDETVKPSATASTGEDADLGEKTDLEKAGGVETDSEKAGAGQQEGTGLDRGNTGREGQVRYDQKAVVLTDRQETLYGNLEEKIFLLMPGNSGEGHGSNVVLLDTDLYVPDLQGDYKKLEEICRNYEKEEILKVLNSSMDLNLDEIELIGYDAFIQKVDEAGGILADVTEDEIAHINNYQLAMTGEALSEENKVTEAGVQELNGIQAAAYLQIRHFPGGYGGMKGRWKQVVWELLKKEGVNIENCYEQFFSGLDRSVYVEGEKGNYLLCFQWEEGVKELHDSLFSGSVYQPSASVKELDSAMKKQAKEAVEDYRNEKSKIFSLFGMYIGKSPYMVSLLKGESLEQETERAWENLEIYMSGISIKEDEEAGRAVYAVNLVFEDSGVLDFPESGIENVSVERFLYLVRREDGWYVDGPLHNNLPTDSWWQGKDSSWKSYDFGFSDEDSLGRVTKGQEEYDAFIKEVREAVEN